MEMVSVQRNGRVRKMEKITLEDYLQFTSTHKQFDLTVNHLNQIIEMHGFKKIHKKTKNVLIEAVESMELMDPSRSTIEDSNISSCAFITLEEAINDLADLNWQDCCVTSMETLNSVNYDLVLRNAEASNAKSKPRRKIRKIKHIEDIATATATGGGSESCGGGGLQSACSSAIVEYGAMKMKPRRRKRNVRSVEGEGGGGATFGGFSSASSGFVQC